MVSPDVVDIGSEYFVVYLSCVYICSADYVELPIVLLYLLRCLVYHMLSKTRRNSGSLHRVIGEVLVLGLLVVVYKIPYSSCIFNTAVVLEPGTMVCAYHTAIWYLVHRSCLCRTNGFSRCRGYYI